MITKTKHSAEQIMSERWPKLLKRTQNETSPVKLIAILEQLDDLLLKVEMRIAAQFGRTRSKNDTDGTSNCKETGIEPSDESEIGSP